MRGADVGRWRELLPTAFLLTGSDSAARDLVARALARGDELATLVRTHLRRRWRGEGAIGGTSGDPWWVSPADAAAARRLAAALDRLPRPDRTAVVLRFAEGLPPDEVAALVPGVDTAQAAARLADEVPDLADLPRRLDGLAALADLGGLTDDDVASEVRAVRSRRRSRAALAVGAVAVLAVGAVALPRTLPAGTGPADATATTTAPQLAGLGEPRGSLVDDEDVVGALRDRTGWEPGTGQVVYAGDAEDIRSALLLRLDDGTIDVAWFSGEAGTAVDELELAAYSADGPAPSSGVWSAAVAVDGAAVLLVVAGNGDEVEVSPGFDVAADGSAVRTFAPVPTEDGVAVVDLGRPGASGVVYRVVQDDVVAVVEQPSLQTVPVVPDGLPPAGVRSGAPPVDPWAYSLAVDQVAGPTGLDPAALAVTVLGAGSFPAPGGSTARSVTVAAVLPSGAVATSTTWVADEGDGQVGDTCGTQTFPAGTDVGTLTVVARCASYAGDSSTFGVTVLTVAPPGAEVVLNVGAGGEPLVPELTDGWGYLLQGATAISEFTADGMPGEVSRAGSGPFDG